MPPLRSLDLKGAIIALTLAALWGANPVAVKIGLADVPPLRLAWMRFVLGGLTVLVYAWWTRRLGTLRIRPGEGRPLLSLGLLFAVQIGLMNIGISRTTAAHGALLLNSYAIHTVVLSHYMIPGDRLTPSKVGGILVAYAGIVLLFAREFTFEAGTWAGDLIVSASALLLGERIVYTAKTVQRLEPIQMLVYQSLIGSACFFLISLWWEADIPTRYTIPLALSLLYQGCVVAGFNFVVNMYLLKIYRPSALAATQLTTPIFGVIVAAVVAGDQLTPILVLSSLMVAAGIGLTSRR
ncbi:MAG TPA: DMT family transporter [Methylomirabilota bacterium]|nr:DMT family transporter [Methylomirabilota bacterium]